MGQGAPDQTWRRAFGYGTAKTCSVQPNVKVGQIKLLSWFGLQAADRKRTEKQAAKPQKFIGSSNQVDMFYGMLSIVWTLRTPERTNKHPFWGDFHRCFSSKVEREFDTNLRHRKQVFLLNSTFVAPSRRNRLRGSQNQYSLCLSHVITENDDFLWHKHQLLIVLSCRLLPRFRLCWGFISICCYHNKYYFSHTAFMDLWTFANGTSRE